MADPNRVNGSGLETNCSPAGMFIVVCPLPDPASAVSKILEVLGSR